MPEPNKGQPNPKKQEQRQEARREERRDDRRDERQQQRQGDDRKGHPNVNRP